MRVLPVLVLSAAAAACNKKDAEPVARASATPPIAVSVAQVAQGEAPNMLTLTGMIAADQRAEVTADTQGKVLRVMIERGQRVKAGEPVVALDVRSAALSSREAQANLASARAQRALAEEECKRTQALLDKGAITRSEYDRQTTQCTSALQQVSAAQARAEMVSKSVADGLVRAPYAGVIADKMVAVGEWVAPGRPLFTLVDDDPLKIQLSVPEIAVRAIKPGQRVVLTAVADREKQYAATITRVGGEIGRTRSLIAEATLDPGSGLVSGMFAEAVVTLGTVTRPVVPKDAVVKRGKTHHAFVVVDGEAEDRPVQIGPGSTPDTVAILRGVTQGESVIRNVTDNVVDGARVTASAAAPAGGK